MENQGNSEHAVLTASLKQLSKYCIPSQLRAEQDEMVVINTCLKEDEELSNIIFIQMSFHNCCFSGN